MFQKRKKSPYIKWLRESGLLEKIFRGVEPSLSENFEKDATNPQAWLASASQLKMAAEILWPLIHSDFQRLREGALDKEHNFIRLLPVWMMLDGMALESVTKGVLVGQDPKIIETKRKFFDHDLFWLLRMAKIDLDEYEQELVGRLIDFVVWAGRYPVPRSPDTYYPTMISSGYRQRFDRLFERVKALLTL